MEVKNQIETVLQACRNEWTALCERTKRRGSLMVEEHRAAIFNEGCAEMSNWLDAVDKEVRQVSTSFQQSVQSCITDDASQYQQRAHLPTMPLDPETASLATEPKPLVFGLGVEELSPSLEELPSDSLVEVKLRLKTIRDTHQEMQLKYKQIQDLH
ncbi:hypothetical protein Ciccas_012216, partial [Cichlidogyrus casuarinus]